MNLQEIKSYVSDQIDTHISNVFCLAHAKFKTASGDITPEMQRRLDQLQNQLADLISAQVKMNLPKEPTEFEKFKVVFELHNPNDPLKTWITEDNFINVYKKSWDTIREVLNEIYSLSKDNGLYHDPDYSINLLSLEDDLTSSFRFGDLKQGFECLYRIVCLYNKALN